MLPAMARHREPAPRRAGRSSLILFLLVLLLATGAIGAYRWATDASGPTRPVALQIPKGATAAQVADILEGSEVIRSGLAFRIAARLRGLTADIQAGRYELTTNMSVTEVLDALEKGPLVEDVVSVTFPEGLELPEVAQIASEDLRIAVEDFVREATGGRYSLPPYLPEETETVEGFLFPKTYDFAMDSSPGQVIARLLGQFETEVRALPWGRAKEIGLTPYEVVIVASMIEREARIPGDRAKVSAVIHNRLAEGMMLQIDATVQYALPGENRTLTFDDLEYESPYNTYLHEGLPPTPVASPGLASLRAALSPADEAYLYYFVVDEETGAHRFYETEEAFCADAPGC
jgi:UPF0755 protein